MSFEYFVVIISTFHLSYQESARIFPLPLSEQKASTVPLVVSFVISTLRELPYDWKPLWLILWNKSIIIFYIDFLPVTEIPMSVKHFASSGLE